MTEREVTAEVWIPLTQGAVAVIDFGDWDRIRPYSWRLSRQASGRGSVYARGVKTENGKQVHIRLHKLLLGEPAPGFEIAHLDGDGLNCRRNNIKFLTPTQNAQGKKSKKPNATSQYRGVSLTKYVWRGGDRQTLRWAATIRANKKKVHLGYFSAEEEAARAYDAAATKFFGEHAAPNFPKKL